MVELRKCPDGSQSVECSEGARCVRSRDQAGARVILQSLDAVSLVDSNEVHIIIHSEGVYQDCCFSHSTRSSSSRSVLFGGQAVCLV